MDIRKGKLQYEGSTKKVYPTNDPDHLIMHFKNDVASSRGGTKSTIKNKGTINNTISSSLFQFLESYHIPTHFVKVFKSDEMLVKNLEIIPFEVRMWNFATASLSRCFGFPKGDVLACPILEFYMKNDKLKNPMITIDHACAFGYANRQEMKDIDKTVRKINAILKSYFKRRELVLVDFRLEFGRFGDQILVGDEISLDNCRFFHIRDGEIQNKELIPQDSVNMDAIYEQLKDQICFQGESGD